MIKILAYTEKKSKSFFKFLKQESANSTDSASENMWSDNWENEPNTLPYILTNSDKFTGNNGAFHLIVDDKKIVGCGGVQIAHFNNKIAVAGIRTWLNREYRNQMLIARYLLPAHKAWALANNCKQVALSFNEYNKNLTRPFTRTRAGEDGARISRRTEDMMFYSGVNELDFKVCIQYTPQWVIYEKLDSKWDFNWRIIKV
jgi:hypothetical protein